MIRFSLQKRLSGAHDFSLDVAATLPAGSFTALTGASGAGKTTLLRLLAGLDRPDAGQLDVAGAPWFGPGRWLAPQRRRIGMVFQDYALFPHLSVRDNVAYGAARGDGALVDELLDLTGLAPLAAIRPARLSGGQRQRVALARAIACRPRLLLLDEALSALDPELRLQLQDEVGALHRRFGLTTVMVSHDLPEVFRLADHVLLLDDGRVAAQGSPAQVYLAGRGGNGRYTLTGHVLALRPADVLWRLTVAVGGELADILITPAEAATLSVGQRVTLSAGALHLAPSPLHC